MVSKPASPGAIKLIAVCSVFQVLALVAVGLRLWSRRLKRRSMDASDWLIIASSIIALLLSIIIFIGSQIGGAGYHQSDLVTSGSGGSKSLDNAAKIVFVAEMMWLASNGLTKLSTLCFYDTMFRVSRFRWVIWMLMGLTISMFVAFVVKDFLICLPVERNWSFEDPGAYCGITVDGTLATGIGITLMDAIIVAAPMPLLLKLQMPRMKKILICAIFSIGLVVCIISALRLAAVMQVDQSDLTYSIIPLGIFTLLEPLLAIIASCLPTLHPVLTRFSSWPLLDWTRRGSKSRKASASGKQSNGTGRSTTLRDTQNSKIHDLNETKNFNRLYDHLYPVTTTTTISEAAGRNSRDYWSETHEMPDLPYYLQSSQNKGGISVTTEFKVDSMYIENPFNKPLPSVPENVSDTDVELGLKPNHFQPSPLRLSRVPTTPEDGIEAVSPMSSVAPQKF